MVLDVIFAIKLGKKSRVFHVFGVFLFIWLFLSNLRLKESLKCPFSYIKWPNFWLYCPAAAPGGTWGYRAFNHLYIELQFLYKSLYPATPCSHGKMELKSTVLCSNLKPFLKIDSKVPYFNLLWGALLGKNFVSILLGPLIMMYRLRWGHKIRF